jgi:hypothetical protein
VRDDVPVDSETFFVIDFMNLKIKPTQFFKDAHKNNIYMYIFIKMNTHTYIIICVFTVFLINNNKPGPNPGQKYKGTHSLTSSSSQRLAIPSRSHHRLLASPRLAAAVARLRPGP